TTESMRFFSSYSKPFIALKPIINTETPRAMLSVEIIDINEPTGNLDLHNADLIFDLLMDINFKKGTAFLIVTHDLRLASRLTHNMEMSDGYLQ
ncbi:MAG: hypothetical protein ACTS8Y_04860, partial [Arsenophonus sp. ER-EMS1-MAG3]